MTKKKLTEDEQAALAYLKLQDDARKLIREIVIDLLMTETTDPMADIVQSEIINIIRNAIEDKIDVSSNDVNPIKLPQHRLQDAILKLAFPYRS
jgi:hypothetical protein